MREKKRGEKNPMYGKHLSKESREKCSRTKRGEKNPFWGKSHSLETKKEISRTSKERWEDPAYIAKVISHRHNIFYNTRIELAIQDCLRTLDIPFETQKSLYGTPDIFLPDYNICIFCDGDYWHANPEKYKNDDIIKFPGGRSMTVQQIHQRDNGVTDYLAGRGFFVFRFWEQDIIYNFANVRNTLQDSIFHVKTII